MIRKIIRKLIQKQKNNTVDDYSAHKDEQKIIDLSNDLRGTKPGAASADPNGKSDLDIGA